jgi:predicted secreted protein
VPSTTVVTEEKKPEPVKSSNEKTLSDLKSVLAKITAEHKDDAIKQVKNHSKADANSTPPISKSKSDLASVLQGLQIADPSKAPQPIISNSTNKPQATSGSTAKASTVREVSKISSPDKASLEQMAKEAEKLMAQFDDNHAPKRAQIEVKKIEKMIRVKDDGKSPFAV